MPVDCQRSTSGGKGNHGMFYERESRVCAAGLPTTQPREDVRGALRHYLLQDAAAALRGDALPPPPPPPPPPRPRRAAAPDLRHAALYCEVASIVNPPISTKFKTLVDDFKETAYSSYWKKPLGKKTDAVPMLPEGFDVKGTVFGRKTPFHGTLYDIVMPKDPLPDKTPRSKQASAQVDRNYCKPAFDSSLTFGYRSHVDTRGKYARCCVTDERRVLGTGRRMVTSSVLADFQDVTQARLGSPLRPNDNIRNAPEGYSFGKLKPPDNLPECLTNCEINPEKIFIKKCLAHLNTLRKGLLKRFVPSFFKSFYLSLKYFDHDKSGWLPKKVVYDFCASKLIRFDPLLIEPLLSKWNAFDGAMIDYKTFVHVINYREPSPDIPKIEDINKECLDFRTTYSEMVKPDREPDRRLMAGLPSGRYFDKDYPVTPDYCCKAITSYLPQESDMKSCICPSVLTMLNVSHRDMYAARDADAVKRVLEAAGEKLSVERFQFIWQEAQKSHSSGLVSYESFRQALQANPVIEDDKSPILILY